MEWSSVLCGKCNLRYNYFECSLCCLDSVRTMVIVKGKNLFFSVMGNIKGRLDSQIFV